MAGNRETGAGEAGAGILVRPVDEGNFRDLATLFEARGGPHHCWCMAFREKPKEDMSRPADARKAVRKGQLGQRVQRDEMVGLLAYEAGAPVGWVSVGPISGYRRLGGPKPDRPEDIWAINWFFVPRARRRQGLTSELLRHAIVVAGASGARKLRATPVLPGSGSYRFMGGLALFEAHGFRKVAVAGHHRVVVERPV